MKIKKVMLYPDTIPQVKNEFVWEDIFPHIKESISQKDWGTNFKKGFYIKGFIQLSTLNSFRRGNVEYNDEREFFVGVIDEKTKELTLVHLFTLMPELKDLYEQ